MGIDNRSPLFPYFIFYTQLNYINLLILLVCLFLEHNLDYHYYFIARKNVLQFIKCKTPTGQPAFFSPMLSPLPMHSATNKIALEIPP